jgi:hypothetical protein
MSLYGPFTKDHYERGDVLLAEDVNALIQGIQRQFRASADNPLHVDINESGFHFWMDDLTQIYLAQTTSLITARSGTTMGTGTAEIYNLSRSGGNFIVSDQKWSATIYNLSTSTVANTTYVVLGKDSYSGQLFIIASSASSSSIIVESPEGGTEFTADTLILGSDITLTQPDAGEVQVPDASATSGGFVNTAAQTFKGTMTVSVASGNVFVMNTTSPSISCTVIQPDNATTRWINTNPTFPLSDARMQFQNVNGGTIFMISGHNNDGTLGQPHYALQDLLQVWTGDYFTDSVSNRFRGGIHVGTGIGLGVPGGGQGVPGG